MQKSNIDKIHKNCQTVHMKIKYAERKNHILNAARWCFLNFGYTKTSMEDIAKRADISRTLIYRMFKDKEDILLGVFEHWLGSTHPEAIKIINGSGSKSDKLFQVSEIMILEPWAEMENAPMASEFHDVCHKVEPDVCSEHEKVMLECIEIVLGNKDLAELFLLSLEGLQSDCPTVKTLEKRIKLLIRQFIHNTDEEK